MFVFPYKTRVEETTPARGGQPRARDVVLGGVLPRPHGLQGGHLLACPQLPPALAAERVRLCSHGPAALSPSDFSSGVLQCDPKLANPWWLRLGLEYGRRVARAAVRALGPPSCGGSTSSLSSCAAADNFDDALQESGLSGSDLDVEDVGSSVSDDDISL